MRSFLVAASLLTLLAARSVAEPATCAILFRDAQSAQKASVTAADLSMQPRRLAPAFPAQARRHQKAAATRAELSRWVVAEYATVAARDAAIVAWRQHVDVESVEAIRNIPIPNDRATVAVDVPWNVGHIGAPAALQEVEADSTLIVAVIDTGADWSHPDLVGQMWNSGDAAGNAFPDDDLTDQNGDGIVEEWEKNDDDDNGYVDDVHGYDFVDAPGQGGVGDDRERDSDPRDDHGHGTHVAGIIAANGSLLGVAPFVRLMAVRAAYTTGFGGGVLQTNDAAAAIVYAVDNGARVLNLSWGDTVESRLIGAAINHALQADVLVVAAVGNDAAVGAQWPAADARVVGVGSHMRSGARSLFSNQGVGLDLMAPGEEAPFPGSGILSLEPQDLVASGRGVRRGTSMAAPHVAGAAAIVMSRDDVPDMATVRALLLDAARRSGADWTADRGHGRLDVLAAVQGSAAVLAFWNGPDVPYENGRLRADGTVWGSAVQRFQITAEHPASGTQVLLRPWEASSVWQQRLVDRAFVTPHQGIWHVVLRVEDTQGSVRDRRLRVHVDDSPPQLDSLFVNPVWRGADAMWLLTATWDEAVSLQVSRNAFADVYGSAGLAATHQQEIRADAALAATWTFEVRNASGLGDTLQRVPPAPLADWQPASRLRHESTSSTFLPESVSGTTPTSRRVVWGQGLLNGARTTVQASQVVQDTLQGLFDLGDRGRPVAYEDVNADGRSDLLVQDGGHAEWWITCPTCEFPSQLLASVATERVVGLFQLDADAAFETILSSRDSLLLYDDATQSPPALMQVLVNPVQQGFAFWGADAAVGDLDGDGRIELVCGDGEGNVSVFEADPGNPFTLQQLIDTEGSYAYDLTALPPDGFVVGRQRTGSVTGDGFATTSYEFLHYRFASSSFALEESWPFAVATGDLQAASTLVTSAPSQLLLVRGPAVYVLEPFGNAWQPQGWFSAADGEAPVVGDLQANGRRTWVLRTKQGAQVLTSQVQAVPHSLTGTSLGLGTLRLAWQPGDGGRYRVRRRQDLQAWQALGETTATTWDDSTAAGGIDHEYEVDLLESGLVVGTSNRIRAHSQVLPRLRRVEVVGPTALRCWFSNPMQASTLQPEVFSVAVGQQNVGVVEVAGSDAGRSVTLLLAQALTCDSLQVVVGAARDDQNGAMDASARAVMLLGPCPEAAFLVQQIVPETRGFLVRFSETPAADAAMPTTYSVQWSDRPLPLAAVQGRSATEWFVEMQQPLAGRGIAYLLTVDPQLRSATGKPLLAPTGPYEVLFNGSGSQQLFVAPNPVRGGVQEVSFLEAALDTRVTVYNLEGERVVTLTDARGGALHWDLRTQSGQPVSSGTYVYVATDSTGRSTGRIVIIR